MSFTRTVESRPYDHVFDSSFYGPSVPIAPLPPEVCFFKLHFYDPSEEIFYRLDNSHLNIVNLYRFFARFHQLTI